MYNGTCTCTSFSAIYLPLNIPSHLLSYVHFAGVSYLDNLDTSTSDTAGLKKSGIPFLANSIAWLVHWIPSLLDNSLCALAIAAGISVTLTAWSFISMIFGDVLDMGVCHINLSEHSCHTSCLKMDDILVVNLLVCIDCYSVTHSWLRPHGLSGACSVSDPRPQGQCVRLLVQSQIQG